MICPKCGSDNVSVQRIAESKLVTKHKGILWWIFIGWWWVFTKWIFFTLPALIIKIFRPSKYKSKTKIHTECVCQSCGYHWKA